MRNNGQFRKTFKICIMILLTAIIVSMPLEGFYVVMEEKAFALPQDSTVFNVETAKMALELANSFGGESLQSYGFELIGFDNLNKTASDSSHTSGYYFAKMKLNYKGVDRTLFILSVKGTSGGEWYSNVDFSPMHNTDPYFAENFLYSAENVFNATAPVIAKEQNPLVFVTGHSRGGAVSNILGLLFTSYLGEENVFSYTFASPGTIRGDFSDVKMGNIFNVILSGDVVPYVPMSSLGFYRAGTDIKLQGFITNSQVINALNAAGNKIQNIDTYYNTKYSLTGPEESADGLTAFDMMLYFASIIANGDVNVTVPEGISQESQLYPVVTLVNRLKANMITVGIQHLPATYMMSLERYNG